MKIEKELIKLIRLHQEQSIPGSHTHDAEVIIRSLCMVPLMSMMMCGRSWW